MIDRWLFAAAVNGFIAVALGAFAAHGLKSRLDAARLATFEVGVRYQMYHALALVAVAWLSTVRPTGAATAAGICFVAGIVLFSGSIYGLALLGWRWLGPITPVGGVSFLAGWLALAWAGWRASRP